MQTRGGVNPILEVLMGKAWPNKLDVGWLFESSNDALTESVAYSFDPGL